jgi:GDP-D-mannose dehydratase
MSTEYPLAKKGSTEFFVVEQSARFTLNSMDSMDPDEVIHFTEEMEPEELCKMAAKMMLFASYQMPDNMFLQSTLQLFAEMEWLD